MIETLRYDPVAGFTRLRLHLDRAQRTCTRLGITFDRQACQKALHAVVPETPVRCRLTIDLEGEVAATVSEIDDVTPPWRLAVSETRLRSDDPWLGVKTTRRNLYDIARAGLREGLEEVIFLNEAGEVCEGTITNVFARIGGQLVTPPTSCGLLPGILRQELLETGATVEGRLTLDDLRKADEIFVGNSLRGLIPSVLARGA